MVSAILSRLVILVFGTLYPAYASYKAVRTKNVKEYVKWMMYWIVFALFCAVETFSDFFLSWFPFYYEFKIIFVLWMLSPITQGSSFLFKKFVHPQLARREKDIDEMIEQATRQGYSTFVDLGNKGFRVILNSVIMGQTKLVDHLRRSYSTSDISNDGQDLVQHHEAIGDNEEDREDELDNRLLEDQAELAKRSTTPVTKSRSSSSAVSLSSVKEEEGEDGEHVISETFNIPASTRRHYSVRDGKTATRQQRCQSLPPSADRYTRPLVIASTNLESKRQFFAKFQSVEKKEIVSFPSEQNSSQKDSKRYLLTRSLSQDSGTARRPGSISLFARSCSVETGGLGLTKFSSESKDVKAGESLLIKSGGGIRVQSTTDSVSEADLPEETSLHQNVTPKMRQDVLLEKGIGIEKCTEDDISISRRSVPRFQNELPAIDEVVPLDISPQPAVTDEHRVLVEHSDSPQNQEDSSLLQICENSAGEPKLNLLSLSSFSDDHSDLIFLNPEDDLDDQCPTPVPEDSPANLSQDDGKKDTATGNDAYSENNSKEKDLASTESDNDSVYQFGSVSSIETGSEEHYSSAWETLSEASAADDVDTSSEGMKVASNLKDEFRPWSAPSSPASFIRGSKYEEYESQSVSSPDSLLVHPRSRGKDEFSWMKSKVQRQMSSPSTASRGIIYSWPSPSRQSDPVYSSQAKGRLSDKSYGHSFDPFQTWHPSSRSGATSHYLHSGASSSSVTYSSHRDRSSHYVRSSSLDLGGDKTD